MSNARNLRAARKAAREHWNKHERKPFHLPKGWPERFGYILVLTGGAAFLLLIMVSPSLALFWFLMHLFGNDSITVGLLAIITIPPAIVLSGTFIGVYLWATRDQWPLNIPKNVPDRHS